MIKACKKTFDQCKEDKQKSDLLKNPYEQCDWQKLKEVLHALHPDVISQNETQSDQSSYSEKGKNFSLT